MPTVEELQGDKDFMAATPADQQRYLSSVDPEFKAAHPEDQSAYLAHVTNAPTGEQPKQGALDTANQQYEGPGVVNALGRVATMLPNMAKQAYHAFTDPRTEEENKLDKTPVVGNAALAAKRMLLDPSQQAYEKTEKMARDREQYFAEHGQEDPHPIQAKMAEAGGKAMSMIPMVGPWGMSLGERAGKGDVSGALTEAGSLALAPEIAHEAMPGGALPGAAEAGARPLPTADAAVRMGARGATKVQPMLPTAIGAVAGETVGHPYWGAIAGRIMLPQAWLGPLLEKGRTFGLDANEAGIVHLGERLQQAEAAAAEAKTAYDAHKPGREQGIPAPKEVLDAYEKTQTALQTAQAHFQAAQEDYLAKRGRPPVSMELSPEQQAAQAERMTPPPTNEKLGARQEKLMADIEAKAPPYAEGTEPLPRMGEKQPGMTEGKPEVPAEVKPEVAPIMTAGKPERAPSMAGLKVTPEGKVEDTTAIQTATKEALGAEKPARMVPATEGTAVRPGEVPPMRGEYTPAPAPAPEVKAAPVPEAKIPAKEPGLMGPEKELAHEGRSPEDLAKVDRAVAELPNQDLQRLGTRFGLDESKYDFSKREATREGGSKHPIEREKFSKDTQEKLPEALKNHIVDAAKAFDEKNPDVFSPQDLSSSGNAARARAILTEAMKRYTDELAAKGQAGGAPADIRTQVGAHNANGGSTFHPEKGDLKGQPYFAVGGEPEFKNPDLKMTVKGGELTAEQLKEFSERPAVKEALAKHPDASIGTWHDTGEDNTVVELVKTPAARDEAIAMGVKNGEKAIYDLKEGKEIPTGGDQSKMSAEDRAKVQEELAKEGQSGGAPGVVTKEAKLPTGDDLIKKYGESSGDPAQTTFILKDGRGVANTGVDHDVMLGGKATDVNPRREQFIQDGNIRVRPRSGGKAGREVAISIPDDGITAEQMKYLQKMSPQLRSGVVMMEGSKAGSKYKVLEYGAATNEALEDAVNHITNDAGKHLPPVSGGSGAADKAAKVAKELPPLPELAEKHLTPEEKLGVSKSEAQQTKFIERMEQIPEVHEYRDIALVGEGARKWYQRSSQAFDAMAEEAPEYFKDGDKEKFINLLAASSPRQSVAMNLRETLRTWTAYVDANRPTGQPLEDLLKENLTSATSKVPNALKAINGEDMWPDITKNKAFKVPSFARNLRGYLDSVTNDGWMSLFAGLDPREISSAHSYHPLSVATRAAAEELGWSPAEAQASIWSFTQALTERGEELPEEVRKHSEDFVDLLAHDPQVRGLLADLGV
jgi:hypothetical protein